MARNLAGRIACARQSLATLQPGRHLGCLGEPDLDRTLLGRRRPLAHAHCARLRRRVRRRLRAGLSRRAAARDADLPQARGARRQERAGRLYHRVAARGRRLECDHVHRGRARRVPPVLPRGYGGGTLPRYRYRRGARRPRRVTRTQGALRRARRLWRLHPVGHRRRGWLGLEVRRRGRNHRIAGTLDRRERLPRQDLARQCDDHRLDGDGHPAELAVRKVVARPRRRGHGDAEALACRARAPGNRGLMRTAGSVRGHATRLRPRR